MSAYQCSDDHIGQLAALLTHSIRGRGWEPIVRFDAAPDFGKPGNREGAYEYVFRVLWTENDRSLSHRYPSNTGDSTPPEAPARWRNMDPLALQMSVPDFTVRVLKAIACYRYQSCEHDGWPSSLACKWMDALESSVIHAMRGWDVAAWGAPFESSPAAVGSFI